MKIFKFDSRKPKKAPSDWFHGNVMQDSIIEAPEPARVRAVKVSFEPTARTAWHTHPLGQTLFVVSGIGLVGLRNEAPKIIIILVTLPYFVLFFFNFSISDKKNN